MYIISLCGALPKCVFFCGNKKKLCLTNTVIADFLDDQPLDCIISLIKQIELLYALNKKVFKTTIYIY